MTTELPHIPKIINLLSKAPSNRTDNQIHEISKSLSAFPYFKKLSKTISSKAIFKNLQIISIPQNNYVFKYGDNPNCFYVVISGSVNILVPNKVMSGSDWNLGNITDDDFKKVSVIKAGQSFGELALLANRPRAASVIAETDAILVVCDRKTYIDHVKEIEKYKLDKKLDFLRKHIWPNADESLAMKSSYYFSEVNFEKNRRIFRENSNINNLYLIVKGKVSVS